MPAPMPWLLNVAYFALLAALSPMLLWRIVVRGKYRTGWREKLLGQVQRRAGDRPCLWFHAVSVGEVLQLEPVLKELRIRLPAVEFVISTTTPTGRSVAEAKFPRDSVCYFPLDFSWAVREAVARLRPTAIILVELELWPNFMLHAHRSGIPVALINGRLSEHSLRGYRRLRPLVARLLGSLHAVAVQNRTYAERFLELGASPQRLSITGSIKFDRVESNRRNPKTLELRAAFGIGESEPVFVAGSTQESEEAAAIEAYLTVRASFPALRLILVPRHKERFEDVARLVESRGLPLCRRSSASNAALRHNSRAVLLLDSLGELSACWGLADVAFVGGSLTNRGGQNMIEPAGYGAAVLFGPNTHNFRDVVERLLSADAARVVQNGGELTATLADCLSHPERARAQGARAQQLVLTQQGATQRTIDILTSLPGVSALPAVSHASPAAA
jgi:3-deoxy-D-manno-octulosonic-acid transferase